MSESRPDIGDRVPRAEAVVAAALDAFEKQDWPRLIALTDAGSLVTLKSRYLAMKRIELGREPPFGATEMELGEVPSELEEWWRNRRQFGELAGITEIEHAEALDDTEFLLRWAQARHPQYLVDGVSPWHPRDHVERRSVVGSVALLPDTVAVVVRAAETHPLTTLAALSMIAVLGDNTGDWALDASSGWLGLADSYL
ncbi:hypothetical protein [Gemmatimonas groenlandica]|uniref:Uncharacterized protein n=1 Tax=Gemmatimonas groenlandica TaxID=2732249 RepID=A0A6M4IP08_9BACT|nr:hypothetical protein [Gemmatimonas groenlandica]QJR34702.1 hypothetical protein HKW67_03830 [Gemmatimonas groenlandica]